VKVLLDENLPHQLRAHLRDHDTATVAYLGWSGLKNGALLRAAEAAGFDVLVTGDLSLEYQQNLAGRHIAVVSLSAQNWRIIKPHASKIVAAVNGAIAGRVAEVNCGVFRRPRR
jgi:putative NIF3 family GTP cyclohydrolase 1 type 2